MPDLSFKDINQIYAGGAQALYDFTLDVKDGEFMTLTGPSRCGKSTVLRVAAGLEDPTFGELFLDGKNINDTPSKDRDFAMIFQNFSLSPRLSVFDNMALGLKMRKVHKDVIAAKVNAAAELLGLVEILSRKPKTITGAERQRVALGRTIVREPKIYLFDEPFSGLDGKLRAQMRAEIFKLHARLKATVLYATSDPIEAMSLGKRVAVLKDGFLQQVDFPQNLYDYPENLFVASFIGSPGMNFFRNAALFRKDGSVYLEFAGGNRILLPEPFVSRIKNVDSYINTGKAVTVGIRPEDVHADGQWKVKSPGTAVTARLDVIENFGSERHLYCDLDCKLGKKNSFSSAQLIARVGSRENLAVGETAELIFDPDKLQLFDGFTEQSMLLRDAGYLKDQRFQEGSDFVPLTPAEERERISAGKKEKKRGFKSA